MMVDPPPPAEREPSRCRPIYLDFNVLQLVALVFLLDQLTKYVVIETLSQGMSYPFRGFFRFTHVHNTGSAFGILQGLNTPLIFVSFVGIIILALIYRNQPRPSNLLRLSLGLQLGGAFGNLIDRLRLGFVTDFIDIGPWPVFNIADAAIVTGLVILGWVFTRGGASKPEPDQPPPESGPEAKPDGVAGVCLEPGSPTVSEETGDPATGKPFGPGSSPANNPVLGDTLAAPPAPSNPASTEASEAMAEPPPAREEPARPAPVQLRPEPGTPSAGREGQP